MPLRALVPLTIGIVLVSTIVGIYFAPGVVATAYGALFFLIPVWLPLALCALAWPLWLTFIRSRFVARIPYVTLELKPGQDTPETARAMELVFYSLYHRTDIGRKDAFLHGKMQTPYSVELYAHDNRVRFFIHLPERERVVVEDRIRAEYRDVEIHKVSDYSRELHFHPLSMRILMREYSLVKPDPYPIKTYAAYEEAPKKRDVFGEVVESLANVSSNEHVFLSLIIRPHQRERKTLFEHPRSSLHDTARAEIRQLVGAQGNIAVLPPSTQRTVKEIELALTKPSFDCGFRAVYIADRGHFNESSFSRLEHLLEPFNSQDRNGFKAYDPNHQKGFFVSEILSAVPILAGTRLLDLYRRRAFFAPPYYGIPFILNTEELATVFHLPRVTRGSVFARMREASLEPPENLPV